MNKNVFIKSAVVALCLVLVSAVGFDGAYGYGGGGKKIQMGSSDNTSSNSDSNSNDSDNEGEVLGEETFVFTFDLGEGMSGPAVVELQARLRAEGFFTFPTNTGYFGPITKAAVEAYQRAHGIPFITGFVGPLTRAELNK